MRTMYSELEHCMTTSKVEVIPVDREGPKDEQ